MRTLTRMAPTGVAIVLFAGATLIGAAAGTAPGLAGLEAQYFAACHVAGLNHSPP
jgi:hypothetical protein